MKRNKQMKNNSTHKHTEKKETEKRYIPMEEESANHDLFIDMLSYGRQNVSTRNDIWTYAYV